MDKVASAAGLGFITGTVLTVLIIVAVVYYVLLVVAWWKMFTKAGEKGWKSIIPFYNFYVQCKLTWAPKWFWISIIAAVVCSILGNSAVISSLAEPLRSIVAVVAFAISIFMIVMFILADYRLAKAYGHGGGFTVGLIFLNFIFMLILGFGKSEYKGNVYLESKKK